MGGGGWERERETALVSVLDICGETRRGGEEMFWRKLDILLFFLKTESAENESSVCFITETLLGF